VENYWRIAEYEVNFGLGENERDTQSSVANEPPNGHNASSGDYRKEWMIYRISGENPE